MTENTQHRITIKIQESTEILTNYKDHDKRYHIPKTGMSVHTAGFNSGVHREQGKCKKRSSRIKKIKDEKHKLFHFSFSFTAAPQTGCTTYFLHWLHGQQILSTGRWTVHDCLLTAFALPPLKHTTSMRVAHV